MGLPQPNPRVESRFFNSARRTAVLLVEAGPDERFWRPWVGPGVLVRQANQGGKAQIIRWLKAAKPDEGEVLVGVVDADLDRVRGVENDTPDVILTDAHDLEATLVGLPALDKLATSLAGAALAAAEARWGESLRARLVRHAELPGRLRWLKVARSPAFDALLFKKEKRNGIDYFDDYASCIGADFQPDPSALVKALCSFSNAQQLLPPKVDLVAAAAALGPVDLAQLCNGHDLMGFLYAMLKEIKAQGLSDSAGLAQQLGLAVERVWLVETAMWKALDAWSKRRGYPVLA
ncbi:MAG: DUF4435 domain-containing protein [Deltaproteobacteria bacterium]|nr:DUF4435 domain-containing protein [Deltaproteobacteria bacterium]